MSLGGSAGVALAALMIPLNIGYAQVAGLPPVAGLYAAIVPLVVFALLASSRHLVTSPDASMATLVGAALVAFAAPGDPLRMRAPWPWPSSARCCSSSSEFSGWRSWPTFSRGR